MSRFSRPRRTRLYDCQYNMGESYYKPMVDHLDRKYTAGRPSEEIPRHFSPLADSRRREITPEELPRRRAMGVEEFANGHREDSLGMSEEMAASMKRIAASKAARAAIENEISELEAVRSSRKKGQLDFGDKMLDSIGLTSNASSMMSKALEDDSAFTSTKRRTLKMTSSMADSEDDGTVTRWTALNKGHNKVAAEFDEDTGSTAVMRARMSRNRLADLDSEMEEIADRAAARERRNNHLRALLQETRDNTDEVLTSSMKIRKSTVTQKSDKKTVTF